MCVLSCTLLKKKELLGEYELPSLILRPDIFHPQLLIPYEPLAHPTVLRAILVLHDANVAIQLGKKYKKIGPTYHIPQLYLFLSVGKFWEAGAGALSTTTPDRRDATKALIGRARTKGQRM